MAAFVFPGQGSQHKGMGSHLFDQYAALTEIADDILGYSIKQLCLEDPGKQLGETRYTQPALYVVNALSYLKKLKESDNPPDYVAGHSLGEYNALLAAGAFDFETGLLLVKKRGELMSRVTGGGMAAVIGLSRDKVESALWINSIKGVEIANFNTPSQIVLSGSRDVIKKIGFLFENEGAIYVVLNVSGAFHSSYMAPLAREFGEYLDNFSYGGIRIPVISNYTARPYRQQEIKKNLTEQIASPVKWAESITYIMSQGQTIFEEVGPGNVLTGLIKKIQREAASDYN